MDIHLAHTELQLLVLCAGRVLQCVARRWLVEENCVSMLGRGLWKRVGPQNSLHFGSRAHYDTNWLSGIVAQAPFEVGFHSCWRRFAFKNDITTGDVGLDARKPGVATHDLQFSHWKLARSANVHCAHECNIFGHVSSISWGARSSPQARCVMPPNNRAAARIDPDAPARRWLPIGVSANRFWLSSVKRPAVTSSRRTRLCNCAWRLLRRESFSVSSGPLLRESA